MKNVKRISLAFVIVILLNMFFNVGLEVFMPAPDSDVICENGGLPTTYLTEVTEEECLANEDEWVYPAQQYYNGVCESKCWDRYLDAKELHERDSFFALVTLGFLIIVAGLLLPIPSAITSGFIYGGGISMLIGTIRYWSNMDELMQFVVTGVALLIMILIGIRKLKD